MKKILAILCMLSLCIVPALAETAADAEEAVEETYQFIVPVIAEGGNTEAVLAGRIGIATIPQGNIYRQRQQKQTTPQGCENNAQYRRHNMPAS